MRLALFALAAVLAGCTLGPNYQRPAGAVANQAAANGAFAGGAETPFTNAGPPAQWWRLYRDPLLDGLIAQALRNNTDLRAAAANIARAQANLDVQEDARWPQASLGAEWAYDRESGEEHLLDLTLPNSRVYGLEAEVAYQVDLFGQIRRTVESGRASLGAAQAAYDATRITVVAQTTLAYVNACSSGREIAVAERSVDLQKESTALTRRLYQAGRGISLDVTRSAAQEDQVRATLPGLLAQKQLALYRLAVLTGKPPVQLPAGVARCVAEPRLDQPIPVGDGAALLRRRPDVRRAEDELHAATAQVGVAEASLFPKVVLGASAGSVGLTRDFWKNDTFKFALGPLISWQIPNPPRARAVMHGAQAQVDAAYARFDGVVLEALREAESSLTVYARDLDRERALASALKNAAKAAADAEALFKTGRQNYLAVLDADRTEIAADQALAAAQSRTAADRISLFLALGGGWQTGAPAR